MRTWLLRQMNNADRYFHLVSQTAPAVYQNQVPAVLIEGLNQSAENSLALMEHSPAGTMRVQLRALLVLRENANQTPHQRLIETARSFSRLKRSNVLRTDRVASQLKPLVHNFSDLIACAALLLPKMDHARVPKARKKGSACQDCALKRLMI